MKSLLLLTQISRLNLFSIHKAAPALVSPPAIVRPVEIRRNLRYLRENRQPGSTGDF